MLWDREMARDTTWIVPTFHEKTDGLHQFSSTLSANDTLDTSGVIVAPTDGSLHFNYISGEWNVLRPYPWRDSTSFSMGTAIRIGDSLTSSNVIEVGIAYSVESMNGNFSESTSLQWAWQPGPVVGIDNVSAVAGQIISCILCVASPNEAIVFLRNRNTGETASFSTTAPPGVTVQGGSAAWLVGRPTVTNKDGTKTPGPLPYYGTAYFDSAFAHSKESPGLRDAGVWGIPLTMHDQNNVNISEGRIESPRLVKSVDLRV